MTESIRDRVMKNMEMAKNFGKEMTPEGCKGIRTDVTPLANKLHKLNLSLSEFFKRAWGFMGLL